MTASRTIAITLVRPGRSIAQSACVWVTVIEASAGKKSNSASAGAAAAEARAEDVEDRVGRAADRRRDQQHPDHFVADRVDQGPVEAVAVALACAVRPASGRGLR